MGSLADLKSKSVKKEINKYLSDKSEGMNLLAKLISANNGHNNKIESELRELEIMIMDEFLELTRSDKCPGSAETYSELQKAFDDLIEIINFPKMENKFTIAVGGQFSSGKSKFLNQLLGVKKLLPEDTSATTSIPTHIIASTENSVFALNNFQNRTEIDTEALHAISHAFKATYNLSFSHILKMIIVERENLKWQNISFLDTPGYSKSDSVKSRTDNTDENIAREHLRNADYLIWIIDIQNGTVPEDDINFIKSLQFDEPILFIFNKADKKIADQINDIIDTAISDLQKNEIKYHDIIGFSSLRNKEYSKNKNVLGNFISSINQKHAGTTIIRRFEDIFVDYLNYHKSESEFLRISNKTVNDAFLEAYKEDFQTDKLKALTRKQKKQIKSIVESEKEFLKLKNRITDSINIIFNDLEIKILEGYRVKRKRKNSFRKTKLYKFQAMAQIQNESALASVCDIKKLKGNIIKVSSIGVSISMLVNNSVIGEIFITKSEVKKKIENDYKEFFDLEDEIAINYLGNKKAVVEILKEEI